MARILVVEDSRTQAEGIRLLLEDVGCTVEVVGNGAEALEAVARLQPEIVLLDVNLPDIDGFEVATRLRDGGASAAVVLTSSHESTDYGPLIDRSGARGFIPKESLSGAAVAAVASS